MRKFGVEVNVRVFTDEWETNLRAVTSVVWTAAGIAFSGSDYSLKFREVLAMEAEQA